jgi:outer membrane biosynthesis protein TonB
MKVSARYVLWLLPFVFLLGCGHKADTTQTQALAPPIEDKPLPPPSTVSKEDLPPPTMGDTKPVEQPLQTPAPPPQAPPQKPPKHSKKTPPPQDTASNATKPSESAIGQLSSGGSGDLRSQIADSIASTEKGLNGITRGLSDQEQKTAAQIHEFLKQAREALTGGDVDGARTLADKAKVLLAELNH